MATDRSIPCPVAQASARDPDGLALLTNTAAYSFLELDQRVRKASARFREAGWGEGAVVGLYLPRTVDYVVLLLALLRAGAIACPLSRRLPGLGISALLARAGALHLISDLGAEALGRSSSLSTSTPRRWLAGDTPQGDTTPVSLHLDQPATLVFTSGSTGIPKAALLAVRTHYFSARGASYNMPLLPGDRWLLSLPLFHVGGLAILFRCLWAGASVVLSTPTPSINDAIRQFGVTHLSCVPAQLSRLLMGGGAKSLKAILLGGSALPKDLLQRAYEAGLPLHTTYGLTEMGSQVTTTAPGAGLVALATAGRVLPYRGARIVDGEIHVRGETRFLGYHSIEGLEQPFDRQGWYATGDLGFFDAQGQLVVQGRKDNLFISGGENIQPEEIEQALCQLAGIQRALVVPVDDQTFGARPVAFVETTRGVVASADWRKALASTLPKFKIPIAFYRWPKQLMVGLKPSRALAKTLAAERQGVSNR